MGVQILANSYGLAPNATRDGNWLNLPQVHATGYDIQAFPIDPGGSSPWGTYLVEVTRVWRRLRIIEGPGSLSPQPIHKNDIFWTVKNVGTKTVDYVILLVWTN